MRRTRRRRAAGGFTLLEVLTALSIMALILVATYGTWTACEGASAHCRASLDLNREASIVLDRMTRVLRCAYSREEARARKSSEESEDKGGRRVLDEKDKDFLGGGSAPKDALIEFLMVREDDGPAGALPGLRRVAWRIDDASGTLFQREVSVLATDKAADDVPWTPLARGVKELTLRFYDGKDWVEDWDSTKKKGLPRAVEVAVVLVRPDGDERRYAEAVLLPVAPPLKESGR